MAPKTQKTKAKINEWDYLKLKCLYTAKEMINKMKDNLWNGGEYLQI